MSPLEAFLVGLLGGIADFLPVGGSGHRILVERVFFGQPYNRRFVGLCEIFSALAATVALRREVAGLLRSLAHTEGEGRRTVGLLAVAVGVAGFVSLPFRGVYEGLTDDLFIVGVLLLVSGLLLYVAEEVGRRTRTLDSLGPPGAVLIGLLQVLASLPGISRSGAAISGGMLLGMTRGAATRFALLLSVPLLIIAGVVDLSGGEDEIGLWVAVIGAGASFVGGFLAVGFLRWYVREFSFMAFAYYLWVIGVFVIGYEYLV